MNKTYDLKERKRISYLIISFFDSKLIILIRLREKKSKYIRPRKQSNKYYIIF